MQLNLIYDPSVASAPNGFVTAVTAAAQYLDGLIANPITVNIQVGYGEIGGRPLAGAFSEGGFPNGMLVSYAQLKTYLAANASSAANATAIANLPATDPSGGMGFIISPGQEKAWGVLPADGSELDGRIGFSSSFPNFNYDPNERAIPGMDDFVGVAEHELTHALGRIAGFAPASYYTLDLFRYSAPGALQPFGGEPAYFSIDGGRTNLNNFDTSSDYADWAASTGPDAFDAFSMGSVENPVTLTDITEMSVLGFAVTGTGVSGSANFQITDVSTGQSSNSHGVPYTGPVSGLQWQYINLSPDNLNIGAAVPNTFIHSGSGDDAIAVLAGANVLDGGTGSNFLTGGSGSDTFFVDDRGPSADIWSTVNAFHAGDAATVWGVTPQDFGIAWVDGQGAAGFTGLTLHATAPGRPTASLTLSGYTSADLSDGRLSVSFGTDPASGSSYMYVHANS